MDCLIALCLQAYVANAGWPGCMGITASAAGDGAVLMRPLSDMWDMANHDFPELGGVYPR